MPAGWDERDGLGQILVDRAADGDGDALLALYDLYAGPVLGYLTLVMDGSADVEEVLLDVFAHAVMTSRDRNGAQPVSEWLMNVAARSVGIPQGETALSAAY